MIGQTVARSRRAALFSAGMAPLAAASAHGLRMLTGLVIIKMIAVLIGPSGLAVLGNFMNITTMISVFAGGGIIFGIGKYVAQYRGYPRRMLRIIGSAFRFGLTFSVIVMAISIVGAIPLSKLLFGTADHAWLIPCLGLAHFFCFFGLATIAVANGLQRPDLFALITVTGYSGCIPIAFFLIYLFGVPGAALALAASISCTAIPAFFLVFRSRITPLIRLRANRRDIAALCKFSLMALASATLYPTTEILIRTQIIASVGLTDAGFWQAMARLSGAYLGFFTMFLASSYMPRLSAIDDRTEVVRLVYATLFRVGGAFLAAAVAIYFLRHFVIVVLFSRSFLPMQDLFIWQLFGDVFRVSSYVIGTLGAAKAATRLYIGAEITQCVLYGSLSTVVIRCGGGVESVLQAYAVTYFVYFCITLFALQVYRRGKK